MAARTVTRTAWTVWSLATFAYFVAVIHRTALGVAGVEAIDRFGVEATALSLLAVLQVGVYALMQVPAGSLLDRWGPGRVILTGTAVMAVGQALMAFSPSFAWALVARVLLGAGDAPLFVAANRLIAEYFPERHVPVMAQVTGLVGQTGQLATALPVAWLLHATGWTTTFATLAAIGAATAVVVGISVLRITHGDEERRAARAAGVGSFTLRESLRAARTNPGVRLGFWTHWLCLFSVNTVALLWGVPFFVTGQGRTPGEASWLLATFVFTNIIVGPIVGRLTARFPLRRSWIVLTTSVIAAIDWAVLLIPDRPASLTHLIVFVAVLGVSGPVSLIGLDFARSFARHGHMGASIGFANMGGFTATIVGVLIVGVTLQAVSPAGTVDYSLDQYRLAFAALAVPWVVGVIGVLRNRRTTRAEMAAAGVVVPPLRDTLRRFRRR